MMATSGIYYFNDLDSDLCMYSNTSDLEIISPHRELVFT